MRCRSGTRYIFTLKNRSTCPESVITFESPPISTEAERQAFFLKITNNIIQITSGDNTVFDYDPDDVTPIFTATIGGNDFVITLGPNPMLVINNVVQVIPPNNVYSYEYVDNDGITRKKNFTFFESFFTLKDEDSNLIYYSDLKIVRYENFDL